MNNEYHARAEAGPHTTTPAAHPIMFWVLTTLALAIFAPCVLIPIWAEDTRLRDYERALAGTIADLQAQLAKTNARSEALLADPLVNERIVRRELNYRPVSEQILRWAPSELAAARPFLPDERPQPLTVEPDPLARHVAALTRWLPAWPWRDLFTRSPNRFLLLMMAGGLLLAAFLLYGPAGGGENKTAILAAGRGSRSSSQDG